MEEILHQLIPGSLKKKQPSCHTHYAQFNVVTALYLERPPKKTAISVRMPACIGQQHWSRGHGGIRCDVTTCRRMAVSFEESGRWFIPLFIGFQPSKVMQDFFHPQYGYLPYTKPSHVCELCDSATGNAGNITLAHDLWPREAEMLQPNIISCSTAISACEKGSYLSQALGQPWMGSWILQSFAGISTNQISPVFFGAGYPRLTMNRDVGYHRESNLISKSWSSCSRLLCHCGRLYLILRHIHTYIYIYICGCCDFSSGIKPSLLIVDFCVWKHPCESVDHDECLPVSRHTLLLTTR